jgi:hypothetical protein
MAAVLGLLASRNPGLATGAVVCAWTDGERRTPAMRKSREKMRLCKRSDPDSVLGTSGECEAEQINRKVALCRHRPNRSNGQNQSLVFMVKAELQICIAILLRSPQQKNCKKAIFNII